MKNETKGRTIKKTIVIIGLGHIGASLAASLSARRWCVLGWDKDQKTLNYCLRKGWIDRVLGPSAAAKCKNIICVVASPEMAVSDAEFRKVLKFLPDSTLVTDVFSSKGRATTELGRILVAHEQLRAKKLRHVWSHPLAGREGRGPASADPTIFTGAKVLINEKGTEADLHILTKFWRSLDCSVSLMSTQEHQRQMARGSHLVHVLAYSLVHSLGEMRTASPSVLGATRVAQSNPQAWASIFMSNSTELKKSVTGLERELKKTLNLIRSGDTDKLARHLAVAHRVRLDFEKGKAK